MKNTGHYPVRLSVLGAWAVAFGCAVGWDVFVLPWTDFLPAAGPAGTLLGFLFTALVMAVIAWNFHYMMCRCPGPGGVYSYAKKAFGHDHGYVCGWFLCLAYAAIVWADAEMLTVAVRYLLGGNPLHFGFNYYVAGFHVCLGDIIIVAAAMGAVLAFTLKRRVAEAVQIVFALTMAAGLAVCFCAAAAGHEGGAASMRPFFSPKGGGPLMQVSNVLMISPWLFVGIEAISCLTADFRFPVRKSFGVMIAAIVASVAAYVMAMLIPVLASGGDGAGWCAVVSQPGDANFRAFDMVKNVLGGGGTAVLAVTLLCAIFTNLIGNTVVAAKLLSAMADDGAMPQWLGREKGVMSARNSVFVIAAVSVAMSALGQTVIGIIVDVALVGTAVAYAYTSAATFKLAKKNGDRFSAATGFSGLVLAAGIAVVFLLPAVSVTMGTVSYLALVLLSIAGLVLFLFAFHRDDSHRFGRSSVVWVSIFLVIVALTHIWARRTADETVRKAYCEIVESHGGNSPHAAAEKDGLAVREKAWHGRVRCDLQIVRDTIVRNSDVQSVLVILALALMIAVYIAMRRRERGMEREKAKAKSYFFSTVSHDIRTPLNAIIGFSEMLKSGFKTEEERRQAVDSIVASGKTLLGLVNDVLDLSKLESGKMAIVPEPTDCTGLLRDVTEAFRLASVEAGIDVRCRADGLPPLMLDPQRIRQIAFNLVGNAVKFTHEGYVEIRATFAKQKAGESGVLRIEVEDTGCGISEEDLSIIGSAYVQVGSKMSRNGGTGLGLAICKQLAAAMGGRLEIKSVLGKGSVFSIVVPGVNVAESEGVGSGGVGSGEVDSPTYPPTRLPANLRILVADDSRMNVMVMKAQLKSLGQTDVASAADGQEALEMLKSRGAGSFDLVLTDMWMPRMDGESLVKAIRADPALSGLRVALVTADVEFRTKFAEAGFDDILLKPVTKDKLAEMLAREAK